MTSRKPNPRKGVNRPALERMMIIWAHIHHGHFPNATTLSVEFEVSTKTIHRDLDFMACRTRLPIRYNPEKNGWETDPKSALPWWLKGKKR